MNVNCYLYVLYFHDLSAVCVCVRVRACVRACVYVCVCAHTEISFDFSWGEREVILCLTRLNKCARALLLTKLHWWSKVELFKQSNRPGR